MSTSIRKPCTARQFQALLLRWFDQHGRKHLPWQQDKTPYRVWVSEIMLQQTQVKTVVPYFLRFMQEFPNIAALASAHEDKVLHLWAGLGYYSRARNLHSAAKMVMKEFAGQFPDSAASLTRLPGVGQSTAGAILSIAFKQRAPILDGNVKRVLARFCAIDVENTLWQLAQHYTPAARVADYTQAIMDLGATVCTRSKPQCGACPLNRYCAAHQQGTVQLFPKKKAARTLPVRAATFLVMRKSAGILLCKRPSAGIWGGLWSLPEISGSPEKTAIQTFCLQHFQLHARDYQPLQPFRHTFSHYHLDIYPVIINAQKMPLKIMAETRQIWYNLRHPDSIGLPKPIQLIIEGLS